MLKKAASPTGKKRPSRTVATQTRFDEATYAKGKVLAAIYDESFNATLVRALKNEIQRYEDRHGALPRQVVPEES
jgi:hypothetical protein